MFVDAACYLPMVKSERLVCPARRVLMEPEYFVRKITHLSNETKGGKWRHTDKHRVSATGISDEAYKLKTKALFQKHISAVIGNTGIGNNVIEWIFGCQRIRMYLPEF